MMSSLSPEGTGLVFGFFWLIPRYPVCITFGNLMLYIYSPSTRTIPVWIRLPIGGGCPQTPASIFRQAKEGGDGGEHPDEMPIIFPAHTDPYSGFQVWCVYIFNVPSTPRRSASSAWPSTGWWCLICQPSIAAIVFGPVSPSRPLVSKPWAVRAVATLSSHPVSGPLGCHPTGFAPPNGLRCGRPDTQRQGRRHPNCYTLAKRHSCSHQKAWVFVACGQDKSGGGGQRVQRRDPCHVLVASLWRAVCRSRPASHVASAPHGTPLCQPWRVR